MLGASQREPRGTRMVTFVGGLVRSLHFDAVVAIARVVLGIEGAFEPSRPIAQTLGGIEDIRGDGRQVEQVLEQPRVIALAPAADDGLHFHVLAREHLKTGARELVARLR